MPRAPRKKLANGRPKIKILWDIVDKMLIAGCNGSSIATKFGMHPQTFYDRVFQEKGMGFTAYQSQKLEEGNDMLAQVQFSKALKGDNTMLVWLGKNRMGQTDKVESKIKQDIEITQKAILELPNNERRNVEKSLDAAT